ncbi:hypothetical protein SAMN04490357_0722 [Streptomyces misionensis]|uniref:Uncharacterized protein n=1 Tax=Streptomyces misionensis TaxID=67331 RepID=A0A1H4N9D2_9ACTN|nr:hypothetical protein [Streptomyces misionensis]SEB91853.1 hypothetical protein SAMN04490357_0722 [Streptomyces misionensis]
MPTAVHALAHCPLTADAVAHTVGFGLALTHRIWRTPTHALILGPSADEGPYGYLTHLRLSQAPLSCAPDLPPAGAEHEEVLKTSSAAPTCPACPPEDEH